MRLPFLKAAALAAGLGLALPALADRLPLPADTPAAYRDECGSCHLPFPPSLLSAADWQRTLVSLAKHFGSDATVDAATRDALGRFLSRHAGTSPRLEGAGDPPRLTATLSFQRRHHEVPARLWRDTAVKSPANCEACHREAGAGNYGERTLRLPTGAKP